MSELLKLKSEIKKKSNPEKAKHSQRFFKTGPGEYSEGDIFNGLTVPECRIISKEFKNLRTKDIQELIKSPIHEERLVALFIMVYQFEKGTPEQQKIIHELFLKNTRYINNWDLVDLSAPKITGAYLLNKPRKILYKLVKSKSLWERRISIISTFTFIRHNDFTDTFEISEILLNDKHDLIHKAVGWMLREIGKKDRNELSNFLKTHYKKMPRTMLRYSIEHYPEEIRQKYLKGLI